MSYALGKVLLNIAFLPSHNTLYAIIATNYPLNHHLLQLLSVLPVYRSFLLPSPPSSFLLFLHAHIEHFLLLSRKPRFPCRHLLLGFIRFCFRLSQLSVQLRALIFEALAIFVRLLQLRVKRAQFSVESSRLCFKIFLRRPCVEKLRFKVLDLDLLLVDLLLGVRPVCFHTPQLSFKLVVLDIQLCRRLLGFLLVLCRLDCRL
jgi:hypothetical protein